MPAGRNINGKTVTAVNRAIWATVAPDAYALSALRSQSSKVIAENNGTQSRLSPSKKADRSFAFSDTSLGKAE